MATGTVRWYNPGKGFGFINADDGGDVFVHRTGLQGEDTPGEGDRVDFLLDTHPKGPIAVGVRVVDRAPREGGCGCTGCCCRQAAR